MLDFTVVKLMYPSALRMAKTVWSFGRSECKRVNTVTCGKVISYLEQNVIALLPCIYI